MELLWFGKKKRDPVDLKKKLEPDGADDYNNGDEGRGCWFG